MFCVFCTNILRQEIPMSQLVERTSLDLRFRGYRLRNPAGEARLLVSITERGIDEPLCGVDTPDGRWLLDGFKRYRCAEKLGIECVPYVSWGEEATQGIAHLLGAARQQPLTILEQARFVVELLTTHGLHPNEVARMLSRSKAWVSARRNLLAEICPTVQEILFRGALPVYSYMVTLRPFMRMNGVDRQDIARFVQAVAGQKLSLREIELLAHGYFRGPSGLRQAIDQGRWKWTLQQMQAVPQNPESCSEFEQKLLRELERLLQCMRTLETHWNSPRLTTRNFRAQAHLLLASLLGRRDAFFQQMEEFYDRSGQTDGDLPAPSGGDVATRDQSLSACQPPHGAGDCQTAG
jgi:hypothetical protein